MHVLHIINDYAGSKVHSNLVKALDELGIQQTVYCPIRNKELDGRYFFRGQNVRIIYSLCIKKWYKYTYHYRRLQLYKDLKKNVDLESIDFIHASTMFSDGALAYMAYKEFGTPYAVAIRATDLTTFMGRTLPHIFPYGRKILDCASKVYFISAAGFKLFKQRHFGWKMLCTIEPKYELRPNGIDDIWIDNIIRTYTRSRNICFVGTFLPRKNIPRIIDAIKLLRTNKDYEDIKLWLIGGGRDDNNIVENLIHCNSDFIEYKGKISDKMLLIESMRQCGLFVMPSFTETFGLVYIEALSQGLPVVYSKDEGIDGLFDDSVGIAVDPLSTEDISNAIKNILDTPSRYGNNSIDFNKFNWKEIAKKYLSDYKQNIK